MKITVQYDEVRNNGTSLRNDAASYGELISRLYAKTSEIQAAWQGSDAQAYISQLESFRPALQEMQEVVSNYASVLQISADAYMNLQNQRAASARAL